MKQSEMLELTNKFTQELAARCADKGIALTELSPAMVPIEVQMSLQLTHHHKVYMMNNQMYVLYNDGNNAHWKEVLATFN